MLDVAAVRDHFPALAGRAVYFDNPGGTQICREALRRIDEYLRTTNANEGGGFRTSRDSDALVDLARRTAADFLNASRPEEIIFGPNMTTLTFQLSRSLAQRLRPQDEIVVTRLDHDANIAPWLSAAQERGCRVRWWDIDVEDCTLRTEDLQRLLTPRTRLVALGLASNAVGTINDVRRAVDLAREMGAWVFVDAVHYAPHSSIDVRELGCDFLVCSAYKFFGPHLGILFGRLELLEDLPAYKVRPADNRPPGKFETGTPSFEAIAGMLGALEYLAWLGEAFGSAAVEGSAQPSRPRRLALEQAMAAIRGYEMTLSRHLLERLGKVPGLRIWGIADPDRVSARVPTVSFTLKGMSPSEVAEALDRQGIYVWDGNHYALALAERLGLESQGGTVRVGPVHYNTLEEVDQLASALLALAH
ncbi:MAG: cysteine desulfurase-like protein [Anaerolineales bacterium]|jgi:cysteine desulfurase family protein (TIGR01976 family)